MSNVQIIDPVTGKVLHHSWRPVSEMPPFPEPSQPSLVLLVLLGHEKFVTDKRQEHAAKRRIHVARFNTNVSTVGNMFSFDMPEIIAWQPVPPFFADEG